MTSPIEPNGENGSPATPGAKKATPADIAEAAARAGLRDGGFGSLSVGPDGARVRPTERGAVRSQMENGQIGWVDAYLESSSAFATPIRPRELRGMLTPADTPRPNRKERRDRRGRRRR